MQTLFDDLLSADNATRKQAETTFERQYNENSLETIQSLVQGLNGQRQESAVLCCVLLKKYYLDSRATHQLAPAQLSELCAAVQASIQANIEA
jgi:hypothetical protein